MLQKLADGDLSYSIFELLIMIPYWVSTHKEFLCTRKLFKHLKRLLYCWGQSNKAIARDSS